MKKHLLLALTALCAMFALSSTASAQFETGKVYLGPHVGLGSVGGTVAFGGVDSRVANPAKPDRSTLLDDIWSHAPFADRNAFYDTVFATSEQWVADGRLSRRDRQAVLLAAGRARFEG